MSSHDEVVRDLEQPGGQARAALELGQAPVHHRPDLLRQVLGVAAPGQAHDHPVDVVEVLGVDLVEVVGSGLGTGAPQDHGGPAGRVGLWYEPPMKANQIPANEALTRLRDGNRRYSQNVRSVDSLVSHSRRDLSVQAPVAIVIGCSDSRAPAEIVFDQGLGDLFVIRVAGPIVAPSQIGSVEFAAERFGTRLVVVMGHTHCGAIEAAIEAIIGAPGSTSTNQLSIVSRVRPSIESLVTAGLILEPERLRRECIRAHVRASVNHLRHGSEIIERLSAEDGLLVVGAELDLGTGEVGFFDGVPG